MIAGTSKTVIGATIILGTLISRLILLNAPIKILSIQYAKCRTGRGKN